MMGNGGKGNGVMATKRHKGTEDWKALCRSQPVGHSHSQPVGHSHSQMPFCSRWPPLREIIHSHLSTAHPAYERQETEIGLNGLDKVPGPWHKYKDE